MKVQPNIFPEYYKNGEDFICQYMSDDIKNGECNHYLNDSVEFFIENLRSQPEDWYYRTKKVTYNINSLGYRTKELNEIDWKNSIVIIGCSCTFGLGVAEDETLSYHLSKLTGKYVVNLGIVGGSNQLMLDISLMLKKKYGNPFGLIMNWTATARFPYYGFERLKNVGVWCSIEKDYVTDSPVRNTEIFDILYSEISHEYITFRNIQEASRCLWLDKTNYYEGTLFEEVGHYGNIETTYIQQTVARDLRHPGGDDYKSFANLFYELIKDKL